MLLAPRVVAAFSCRARLRPRRTLRVMSSAAADADALAGRVRALVPALAHQLHKGQAGKIGVLGGCREYTGAPFFAAMSALRVGADLSHVFCTRSAAPVIKSYSPELIVHPYLRDSEELSGLPAADELARRGVEETCAWLSRLDALVVGPGLGRDEAVLSAAEAVVSHALERGLPLVLDGDGLFIVTRKPQLLQRRGLSGAAGQARVVLTPNVNEFRRLADALGVPAVGAGEDSVATLQRMSQTLGGAVIVQKAHHDQIADASGTVLSCSAAGAPRRCGGQGDVLAGTTGVFVAWAMAAAQRKEAAPELPLAAYGACLVTRAAAARAFEVRKRSMVAGDLIGELGAAVEALAPWG